MEVEDEQPAEEVLKPLLEECRAELKDRAAEIAAQKATIVETTARLARVQASSQQQKQNLEAQLEEKLRYIEVLETENKERQAAARDSSGVERAWDEAIEGVKSGEGKNEAALRRVKSLDKKRRKESGDETQADGLLQRVASLTRHHEEDLEEIDAMRDPNPNPNPNWRKSMPCATTSSSGASSTMP